METEVKDNETLPKKIGKLERRFRHRINDTHIFAQQAIPLLELQKQGLEINPRKGNQKYPVPSTKTNQVAQRDDRQIKAIYERFISREMYENFIVNAVSQFESLLFDILRAVINAYPQKLTVSPKKGAEVNKNVSLDVLLTATDLSEALATVIDKRLNEVSYASPKDYLEYVNKVIGVDTSDDSYLNYLEIKATRDLIIHNSGVVNDVYLYKSGIKKRGELGEMVKVDVEYFNHCIATLKKVSHSISRYVEKNFR
jgi:hypothetical protein